MAAVDNQLLVQILAACATLIGFIIFFFVIDWYAYKKALRDMEIFKSQKKRNTKALRKEKMKRDTQ